jgi:hypothetical protein
MAPMRAVRTAHTGNPAKGDAMRKSNYTGRLEPASIRRAGMAQLTRIARYVGLALYMVDPVHGAAEAALVAEYSNGAAPAPECEPRESGQGMWT